MEPHRTPFPDDTHHPHAALSEWAAGTPDGGMAAEFVGGGIRLQLPARPRPTRELNARANQLAHCATRTGVARCAGRLCRRTLARDGGRHSRHHEGRRRLSAAGPDLPGRPPGVHAARLRCPGAADASSGRSSADCSRYTAEQAFATVLLDADWPDDRRNIRTSPTQASPLHAAMIWPTASTHRARPAGPRARCLRHRGCATSRTPAARVRYAPWEPRASFSRLLLRRIGLRDVHGAALGATLVLAPQEMLVVRPRAAHAAAASSASQRSRCRPRCWPCCRPTCPTSKRVIAAGERCTDRNHARRGPQGRRFFNAYGPTETTVCATMYRCDRPPTGPSAARPSAGPSPTSSVYVVDRPATAAHRRARRAAHRRRRRRPRLPRPAGTDRGAVHAEPVRALEIGSPRWSARLPTSNSDLRSTAPAIWSAGCPTATSNSWAASTTR